MQAGPHSCHPVLGLLPPWAAELQIARKERAPAAKLGVQPWQKSYEAEDGDWRPSTVQKQLRTPQHMHTESIVGYSVTTNSVVPFSRNSFSIICLKYTSR